MLVVRMIAEWNAKLKEEMVMTRFATGSGSGVGGLLRGGGCVAVLVLALAGAASALPVTWTLQGITLDDGSTASGSFVADAGNITGFSSIRLSSLGAWGPAAATLVSGGVAITWQDPGFFGTLVLY